MKTTSVQEIKDTLVDVGIGQGDSVFIHSSLFTLGKIQNVTPQDIPLTFLSCFTDVIGEQGNVFMPCFNYDFPRTRQADLNVQKTVLGYWPEWFRNRKDVVRSGHPMFSVCGIGPDAKTICQPEQPEFFAFGDNSTFSRLVESDCVLILQGIGLRVATVVVQIEAMLGLKYRFNKPFMGEVTLTDGQVIRDNFYHFCFPLNNAYRENYSPLEKALLEQGVMKKSALGRSFIYAVRMADLFNAVQDITLNDKFALLNCRPHELYRFEDGKEVPYSANKY
ncbi:AAC(3) family N-acetyltransferase [Pseudoalteromonas umbrosa]|uniref:AAC(3) family N-acetyltransferase n=1 Tax=Pseudoalteromonas umbrosa TaxID=3048489 RepID=UPI0024C3805C|nr:AAC(3) family N-acetyltransferase [Pseudoalteromonas sp. B95]MDK1285603.1 AAC(3) family N-acetyltransferase [Pseudoalteromonas sp. B95]